MASSSSFSSLTNDILIAIFTYLPATSIRRSKSVSKLWLSLLSDPIFLTRWFQYNKWSLTWIQYHMLAYPHPDDYPSKFRISYPDSDSRLNDYGFSFQFLVNDQKLVRGDQLFLFGSSNGLVLCFSKQADGQGRFHVCNPLTQKWVSLPSPPSPAYKYDYNGISCENSSSAICCFKVVCIPSFWGSNKFNVDTFDSDLGEWRSFVVSCDEVIAGGDVYRSVVTLNGVLFLLQANDSMLAWNLNQNTGSNEHRCSVIRLPGPMFSWHEIYQSTDIFYSRILGESEGQLLYAVAGVTDWSDNRRKATVNVWVLDEDNWRLLHENISVDESFVDMCFRTCNDGQISVSGFSPDDQDIILLGIGDRVWWYDIEAEYSKKLERSSLLANRRTGEIGQSFVLQTMPTILPPPSWIDEDNL